VSITPDVNNIGVFHGALLQKSEGKEKKTEMTEMNEDDKEFGVFPRSFLKYQKHWSGKDLSYVPSLIGHPRTLRRHIFLP